MTHAFRIEITIRIEMLFIRLNAVEMCGPEKGLWVVSECEIS